MTASIWVPALLVFLAAIFATMAAAYLSEVLGDWSRRRRVSKRLRPVLQGRIRRTGSGDDLIRAAEEPDGFVAALARSTPGLRNLNVLLEQAQVGWTVQTFLVLALGFGLAAGALAFMMSRSWFLAFISICLGALGPYVYVRRKRTARFRRFEEQFPEAIDLLTRAIRAGHPISAGLVMVADEGPAEVAAEFRQTSEEHKFGLPFEDALLGMVDRTDLVDVRIFTIAVLVQREVGGNLVEILEGLAGVIRRRFYLRRQLRVYTAQGRMTGFVLAALPPVVAFVLYLIEPEYMEVLFTNLFGWVLIGTALTLQGIGGLWIKKIITIDM